MSGHRWSGWPGAWCLDCGIEDPIEQAIADGKVDFDEETGAMTVDPSVVVPPCPEPGSRRFDPYFGKDQK